MASNSKDSVNSASPTAPKVERGVFQGAWNAFKAVFNTHTAATPATHILDGIYVEVLDDMETAVVDSKMNSNKERVEKKPVTNLEKKVYDLNFLLELGKKATKAPHPLKFSIDAIRQNILKVSNLSKHNDPRARGLSNVSKASTGSDAEELLFKRIEPKEQQQPYRQPECPPDTPLAQVHAGFRKFLREHSSPPHSRVTAGGRIVPVGPHGSSPPSFNLSSIADVIHGQPQAEATSVQQVPSTTGNVKGHGRGSSSVTMDNPSSASTRHESQGNSQHSEASFVTAQANTDLAPVYVANFPTPLPLGAQVLMKLAHGPTLVAVNGALFEAISEGVNTILAPLNGFKQSAQLAPAPMHPAFPMVAPMPMTLMQPMPLMNVTNNVPIAFNQPAVEVQRQALQKQLDELRTQLDQLDKHVALHRSQIGSYALSSVVAQRRQLVVQIDATRVAKENLDRPTQMNSRPFNAQTLQAPQGFSNGSSAGTVQGQHFPGIGLPALAGGPHTYGAGFPVHAGIPVHNVAAQLPPRYRVDSDGWKAQHTTRDTEAQSWQQRSSGTTNQAFSSNPSATQSIPAGLEYGKDGWKAKEYTHQNFPGNVQGSGYEPTTFDYLSGAIWSHGRPPDALLQGHNVTHNEFRINQPSYGLAHQQAVQLPYVSDQEASYATILGLNPPNQPKKYCSTRAEFAEVIRQARDQARLCGRVGWSKNDPQDDAEEDIRWAMADHARIPLPQAVPDYLSKPQPWDWESQRLRDDNNSGTTFMDANGGLQWGNPNPSAYGHPINRENPAQGHGYAQAQAELFRGNQYHAAYGQETRALVTGPLNPVGNQTTWTENGNGELTRQSKHAYVEDAPETPARHGFNNGSVNGVAVISQAYPAVPNTWGLPTLDECDTKGKSKGSWASRDSWPSNLGDDSRYPSQPEYMRHKFTFEINGKEVSAQEAKDDAIAKELAAISAMNSSSEQNNQKDFLRTMLRDHRHSSADSHTKSHGWSVEELRRLGLNEAGFPIGYPTASSSVNKENQRSGSYTDMPQVQNVMAPEGGRNGGMQNFGGYKDARMYKAGPSVAAPLYQARGRVPQYDGAMDSLSSDDTATTEGSSEASSRPSSGQVTRAGDQAGSKASFNAMAPYFYEPVRRFPTSEGVHYEAVDNFFNTIREEERQEIAKYKAQFPLL